MDFAKLAVKQETFTLNKLAGWQSAMGQLWNEKGLEELSGCPWDITPSASSPFSSRGAGMGCAVPP